MKRIIGTILAALAASISSAQDIDKTAEQLYQKAPTFSETVRQTRLKYAEWAKGQYAQLEQLGVSFSEWHASCAISKWRSSLSKIDPANPKRRFDLSDV
ncbi:MAG: hypothetical protein IJI37_04000, partial [Opitutales bacterium]|nr:hypothetical protein [Opitutales bacterium]